MPPLPPELRVEIRRVGTQYLAVTERPSGGEICQTLFDHDPGKLVHLEPQWMLEKGARAPAEALRAGVGADAEARLPEDQLLAGYGQRLYGYLTCCPTHASPDVYSWTTRRWPHFWRACWPERE